MFPNNINSLTSYLNLWTQNSKYFEMLTMLASLSRLFSESEIPYLDYRITENLFCKYFNAINDARACTAYDAHFPNLGIGIKTFILHHDTSVEKIAEFNKLKPLLDQVKGFDLARKLGQFRNERMMVSNSAYGLGDSLYHIVGRDTNQLKIFNLSYDFVNVESISDVKENSTSLHFNDGLNEYTFNKSKSVLMRRFIVPYEKVILPVDILSDPLEVLESILYDKSHEKISQPLIKGTDYVVLPLYSVRNGSVPTKSGLNQWNAKGRTRNLNEIYIPIPSELNKKHPDFFPSKDKHFELILPDNTTLIAKKCQDGEKALMSNPNSALGEWLLRKVMHIQPGTLVTMEDLKIFGFDSITIYNLHTLNPINGLNQYRIQFSEMQEDYKNFIKYH